MPNSYRFALKNIFTIPRCKVCNDKLNVNADIVLGDPWGMSGVDWDNGDSLIITRTSAGKNLVEDLLAKNLIIASEHDISEVINGQHVADRNKQVEKELHTHSYFNAYREIENQTRDELVVFGRQYIFKQLRRKRLTLTIPYKIFRKILTIIKRLR